MSVKTKIQWADSTLNFWSGCTKVSAGCANCYAEAASFDVLNGRMIHHDVNDRWTKSEKLNWLIVGGESGPNARPCNVEWIRSLVKQGKAAGVATFVKQLGSNPITQSNQETDGWPPLTQFHCEYMGLDGDAPVNVRLCDKKGGDILEWPKDLRVQEWPEGF